jgi:ribonuclease HI
MLTKEGKRLIVCTFVDDNLICGVKDMVEWFRKKYLNRFKGTSDDGLPEDYLGAQLTFSETDPAVTVHMSNGIVKFLIEEGFVPGECRTTMTPAVPGTSLHGHKEGEELYHDIKHYQHVVGTLMYHATRTRPDIANAVRELSRFTAKPTAEHWKAAEHCMRYLAGTPQHGLTIRSSREMDFKDELAIYADASFAGDLDTRRSTTGFVLMVGGAAIRWTSSTQRHVTSSTAEAELEAVNDAFLELLNWHAAFVDMDLLGEDEGIELMEDNQAAIFFANGEWVRERSRHMAIRNYRVREIVASGLITLVYIASADNIADIMTKNLVLVTFMALASLMMGEPMDN